MTPPQILLAELAAHRARGAGFEEAWTASAGVALAGLCDTHLLWWRLALNDTRDGWWAAFEGRPALRPERAVSLIAEDRDLVAA